MQFRTNHEIYIDLRKQLHGNKLLQNNKTVLHFYTKLTNTMDNGAKSFASRILSPVAIIEVGSIFANYHQVVVGFKSFYGINV